MKTMRWLIVTVFICVMALSIPSAVQAEEADDNMNTKFTVKPIFLRIKRKIRNPTTISL